MSYILDALKRAEAERSRGEVPNIHAPPVPVGDTERDGSPSQPLVRLGGILGLILLVAAVWWWSANPSAAPGDVAVNAPVPAALPPVVARPEAAAAPPTAGRPAPSPRPQQPAVVVSAAPSSPLVFRPLPSDPVARPAAEGRVYQVKDLPNDIRAALPAVAVGGASYSENPASRMLIINGQIYHEGDRLTPELTLQQIQLRTAVLSFRGYRYAISY
ncbi:MAG: general secretion pathway protein GspB [Burkholderiaceae bacterium]|nr:general secretion pathway protein GspB [Burkholderiaceae bacterium]